VKGDKGRVLDKAKDYGIELGKYSLDALKDEGSSSLKNTGVDAAKAYIDVSKAAFAYNDAIEKITDELLSNQEATASQHASLKVMLLRQARSLQAKIDEIQDLLSSCNIQLA
jgi:DNA topoisomerase IB